MAARIGTAKIQGFRNGDLIDHIRENSFAHLLYTGRGQLVCNLLVGEGLMVTPLSGVLFRPAANATKVHLALAVAAPSRLFTWAHSTGSFPGPACAHSGSRPAAISTAVRLTPGPGAVVLHPPSRDRQNPAVRAIVDLLLHLCPCDTTQGHG